MTDTLRSVLLGTSGLSIALAAALLLTLCRPLLRPDPAARGRVIRLLALGIAVQGLHFAEELITKFYVEFPQFLGLSTWTSEFFVVFNLVWLAIWVLSAIALRAGMGIALFPIWFFAIAMTANGIAHPILALGARAYFPGLVTSPAVGIVGVLLWARLLAATQPRSRAQAAR